MRSTTRLFLSVVLSAVSGRPVVRRLGFRSNAVDPPGYDFVVSEEELTGPVTRTSRRGRLVDVFLPPHLLFQRTVELPRMSVKDLDRASLLDLERRTPFTIATVFVTRSPPERKEAGLLVRQWIIKRGELDRLTNRLSANGYTIRRVEVADRETRGPLIDRSRLIAPRAHVVPIVNIALAAVLTGSFFWSLMAPVRDAHVEIDQLRAETALLATEAVNLRRAIDTASAQADSQALLQREMAEHVPVSRALELLTTVLPDDVWTVSLEIQGQRISASVTSVRPAAELVLLLAESPRLEDVRIAGPIARLPDGRERFDLELNLRRDP